eukprot:4005595-Pyramimonas_sp.AAC.1
MDSRRCDAAMRTNKQTQLCGIISPCSEYVRPVSTPCASVLERTGMGGRCALNHTSDQNMTGDEICVRLARCDRMNTIWGVPPASGCWADCVWIT